MEEKKALAIANEDYEKVLAENEKKIESLIPILGVEFCEKILNFKWEIRDEALAFLETEL